MLTTATPTNLCPSIFTIMVITQSNCPAKELHLMVPCAFQHHSTCLARWRKGQRIDISRHIRAVVKINLLHYEACRGGGDWASSFSDGQQDSFILEHISVQSLNVASGSWWKPVRGRQYRSTDLWCTVIYFDWVSFTFLLLFQASLQFLEKIKLAKHFLLQHQWLVGHFCINNVGSPMFPRFPSLFMSQKERCSEGDRV